MNSYIQLLKTWYLYAINAITNRSHYLFTHPITEWIHGSKKYEERKNLHKNKSLGG